MFKDTKKQFINILEQEKQIKLDLKVFENNKSSKTQESTFIKSDKKLSQDILTKISILESQLSQTYITSIVDSPEQHIKLETQVDNALDQYIPFDDQYILSIPKKEIEKSQIYFENRIDFLVSPFSILQSILKSKSTVNSLNCFIYNNKIYMIILNENKKIATSYVAQLPLFGNVQESNFYTDDIQRQKLYDEVYFLQLQQICSEFIETYYQISSEAGFIETINIYYVVKQLQDEQLDALEESLYAKVNYVGISASDYLYAYSFNDVMKDCSFLVPRVKKSDNKLLVWGSLALLSFVAAGYLFYVKYQESELKEVPKIKKEIVSVKKDDNASTPQVEKAVVKLPNHISLNTALVQHIQKILEMVPYDGLLEKINLEKDEESIALNIIKDSSNIKIFEDKLYAYYKNSKKIFNDTNDYTTNLIYSNTPNEGAVSAVNASDLEYTSIMLLSTSQAMGYLKKLCMDDIVIKFIDKTIEEYISYEFEISKTVTSPKEFYDIVNNINTQKYSITILKPIEMKRVNDRINLKFHVKFSQNKQTIQDIQ